MATHKPLLFGISLVTVFLVLGLISATSVGANIEGADNTDLDDEMPPPKFWGCNEVIVYTDFDVTV